LEKHKWLFYTKPFIMPVLIAYYVLNMNHVFPVVILALAFATIGDFFLMWPEKKGFFISGLISFFVMQLLYITFVMNHQIHFEIGKLNTILMCLVYLLLGTIIFILLYKFLKKLMIPVIFYILALLAVSYLCFFNVMEHRSQISFIQYLGSLLFIVSDTILAIDSFRKTVRYGGLIIMVTYILAQIFLLAGFMNT
jgi:uncharacterized membrane protein YhhN